MKQSPFLRDDSVLACGVAARRASDLGAAEPVSVMREPNPFRSSFPSEIVEYAFDDGSTLKLLLKYHLPGKHTGHGYWGDVFYEAAVYEHVLRKLPVTTPLSFGMFEEGEGLPACHVIEYVDEAQLLSKSPMEAIVRAAEWLAGFHASTVGWAPPPDLGSVKAHTEPYYTGWAHRTLENARSVDADLSWLPSVCQRFTDEIGVLTEAPATLVHGEFYHSNILVRADGVYPVDWQSLAVARGEVDLASLLEGFDQEDPVFRECLDIYERTRWPGGSPDTFRPTLAMALLYWPFRWLGDKPEWTVRRAGYFRHLRALGERMGWI